MANIGTLFYILWFLGNTLVSSPDFFHQSVNKSNALFYHSNTISSTEFFNGSLGVEPQGLKKIVIDAGHGGHDHGCSGKHSSEKDITLSLALKLGKKLKSIYPEMEVVYTRTKDVFVPLHKRIDMANKEDADIFISIHANAFKDKSVSGTEVFVMGLHTAEENLRVARRENASVLFENDFIRNYDGYDPNSPEAEIILSMYQNLYLEKSIELAKYINDDIVEATNFLNRGVKQAGFVILRKATMPSVLIEAGFLSNLDDEKLLDSKKGQNLIAEAIAKAVGKFEKDSKRELSTMLAQVEKPIKDTPRVSKGREPVIYRVQLAAYSSGDQKYIPDYIGVHPVDLIDENGLKKLLAGKFNNYEDADEFKKNAQKSSGFEHAFIVAYYLGERIDLNKASKIKQRGS